MTRRDLQNHIFNSVRLPARLNVEETAVRLGFQLHDIPILVAAKLLKPLGRPTTKNTPKYFAQVDIEQHATDPQWLHRATDAVRDNWRRKNSSARGLKRKHALS